MKLLSGRRMAWQPIPAAVLIALALRPRGVPVDPQATSRSDALGKALASRGLVARADGVTWIGETGTFGRRTARAIVRAAKGEDPPTLQLVETRVSPEGVLLDVVGVHPLTKTDGIEETTPAVRGTTAVTALIQDGAAIAVKVVDLDGEPPVEGPEWTRVRRLQNAVTNWQETGQARGLGRRTYQLVPAAKAIAVRFDGDSIVVTADGREGRLPERLGKDGREPEIAWLRPQPHEKGQVGNLVTWAVDRVRNAEWFGDERMQTIKAIAFGLLDRVEQTRKGGQSAEASAKEIQEEIGGDDSGKPDGGAPLAASDPESGFPPAKLEPPLKQPIAGEGEWTMLEGDPFIGKVPGFPAVFARTFLRTDPIRPYTRIHIALWDPRVIALHPMGGSAEPVNAAGTAASGLIPREPKTMKRLVAAFNGGFQALHGEFGVMADSVVYLPPKPYGATVMELRDGGTAFGVWPNSPDIPEGVVGYRQNLTPLVLHEKHNPYGRTWWGGTPPGWEDKVHTTRSGLCLTKEHFVAYFYGNGIGAEDLATAMIKARCKMGMHLDMNPGHTGLEFYRAAPSAEWEPLGRAYQGDWETEDEVNGMQGFRFRGRRMVRGMGLMNFPRYIRRESRDFFYLTARPVLPGADLLPAITPPEPNEGKWRTQGLPQHGFPAAVATTTVRPDKSHPDVRYRVLVVDPAAVAPADKGEKDGDDKLVLFVGTESEHKDASLFHTPTGFVIAKDAPKGARALFAGATGPADAVTGFGVDDDGHLVVVELDGKGPHTGAMMDAFLQSMGCKTRLFFSEHAAVLLGGTTTLAGAQGKRPSQGVRLVRKESPGGRFLFPDTPVVAQSEWFPLQQKRIRYFKKAAE